MSSEVETDSQPSDFATARFTAIVSDMHLCEAEPVNPKIPLWKKFKTREFFFDDLFVEFLERITRMSGGDAIELILNGDIFDFDSVTSVPTDEPFRVDWFEKQVGLNAESEKSVYKMARILDDHPVWIGALRRFLLDGHRVVFVIGNHDLELHWPEVQELLLAKLDVPDECRKNVRFCEWFYISNGDTFIEHGNQQDPYCLCLDPINPYVLQYNKVEIRLPFGNIANRYMLNRMGFFNPHVDSNYLMSVPEYIRFFYKYMMRTQPLLIWTWFSGAFLTLSKSIADTLLPSLRNPRRVEDRICEIAQKANATPRMVRELRELFVHPATRRPLIVAQELWLDRAFLLLLTLVALLEIFIFIKQVWDVSFFWMFVPILAFVPFFMFYSRSVRSNVVQYKEPRDDVLAMTGMMTQTRRIVHGHTHVVRHEIIGAIEHLNPGSWSPAFLDVECTKPTGHRTFVWIHPGEGTTREARIYHIGERPSEALAQEKIS